VSLSKMRYMSAMKQRVREMTTRTSMIFSKIFCRFPSSSTVCSMVAVLPKKVFFPVNCRAAQGSMSEHYVERDDGHDRTNCTWMQMLTYLRKDAGREDSSASRQHCKCYLSFKSRSKAHRGEFTVQSQKFALRISRPSLPPQCPPPLLG
jgi:hypothetical protein